MSCLIWVIAVYLWAGITVADIVLMLQRLMQAISDEIEELDSAFLRASPRGIAIAIVLAWPILIPGYLTGWMFNTKEK